MLMRLVLHFGKCGCLTQGSSIHYLASLLQVFWCQSPFVDLELIFNWTETIENKMQTGIDLEKTTGMQSFKMSFYWFTNLLCN